MKRSVFKAGQLALAAVAGTACLFVSDNVSQRQSRSFVTEAHAIIGRPLTPLSYAGAARRTTRRAVAVGTAAAAGAAAATVVRPGCVQLVNAYGQLYWRCP
jgi:hypothetical protein